MFEVVDSLNKSSIPVTKLLPVLKLITAASARNKSENARPAEPNE